MAQAQIETADWINKEAAKLDRAGDAMGSARETDLLVAWKRDRPEMFRRLGNLAPKLAYVLVDRLYQSMQQYLRAGMPPTDALEQATREWCLLEPEEPTDPYQRASDPTSTSTIPTG